jgi:hypothetical protein
VGVGPFVIGRLRRAVNHVVPFVICHGEDCSDRRRMRPHLTEEGQVSDAVIGAGAALAGVLLTGGFGLVFDRRRRSWEDRRRWHDDRRRAYAELLFAARFAFAGACRGARLAVERGAHSPVPEWEVGYRTEDVHSWMRRANEASAEVQLIASEPVRTAAADLLAIHRELGELLQVMLVGEPPPGEEVIARVDALEEQEIEARRRFWMAARVELGIDTKRTLPRLLAHLVRRENGVDDLLR